MKKQIARLFLFFGMIYVGSPHILAQSDIAIGQWKSYLPYNEGLLITQSEDKVIYATELSIVTIDKSDFSIDFLTKVEGLSDVNVSAMAYNTDLSQLVISYENSNIDVLTNEGVLNVPNIKKNNTIAGSKRINDIYINTDNKAYFSAGFGIVEYDLAFEEFGFTSFTDLEVYETTVFKDIIFAATPDGLYSFPLSSNFNAADFSLWTLLDDNNGLPSLYEPISVAHKDDHIYMATERELYISSDGVNFTKLLDLPYETFITSFLSEFGDGMIWGMNINATFKGKALHVNPDGTYEENKDICGTRLTGAVKDEQGRYWYADSRDEIKYTEELLSPCVQIFINGPRDQDASDIDIDDGVVYVASGGVSETFGYQGTTHGFYILRDGEWENVNKNVLPSLGDNNYFNVYQVAKHPDKELLYVGSYYSGLMEYNLEDQTTTYFDTDNSSLGEAVGDSPRIRISGLAFDEEGNLWVSNFGAQKPLSVYSADGRWQNFSTPSDNKLIQLTVDESGYKWIVVGGNNGGVIAFDSGIDPIDLSDDQPMKLFNLSNSALQTSIVNCVEVDLDGDIWVGSEAGPIVFDCGSTVFESSCMGNQRIFVQDSIPDILLKTEDIRAIEVDGANRKWFGTKNGIFVQSPNTETQIHHFTEDNSPLLDNVIRDLEYNPINGEMMIATDKGLIAYRSETTGGNRVHKSNIYAFPNPVRPDYSGPIAINGLATDAEVKITDVNGRLVHETNALGGQAIWDGTDYNGRRVSTGVYLVFSSSTDSFLDPDSAVTKLLFVN